MCIFWNWSNLFEVVLTLQNYEKYNFCKWFNTPWESYWLFKLFNVEDVSDSFKLYEKFEVRSNNIVFHTLHGEVRNVPRKENFKNETLPMKKG